MTFIWRIWNIDYSSRLGQLIHRLIFALSFSWIQMRKVACVSSCCRLYCRFIPSRTFRCNYSLLFRILSVCCKQESRIFFQSCIFGNMKQYFENSCENKIQRHVLCCVLFTSIISVAEFVYCPVSGDVINMNVGSPGQLKNWVSWERNLWSFISRETDNTYWFPLLDNSNKCCGLSWN